MSAEPIHLATGIFICGKPTFWCRVKPEIDYEANKVMNGTDKLDRATCTDCRREYDETAQREAKRRQT